MNDIMTTEDAAAFLGMSLEGTYKAIQRGSLTARKFGRKSYIIDRAEAQRFKDAREIMRGRRGA